MIFVNSFLCFHNPYSEADCGHPRGGISCLISNKFMQYVVSVIMDMDNFIKVIVNGNHTLFGNYIPPVDSIYFSEDCFADISNVFMPLDSEAAVIGGGDLNGRFGNLSKSPMLGAKYRPNPDKEINSYGKTLKNISAPYGFFILDNLSLPDKYFDGNFTFRKGDRKSQVDVCLSNRTGINFIESFEVKELGWNPSDHHPITVTCTLPVRYSNVARDASEELNTEISFSKLSKPRRIKDNLVNWDNYSAITETDMRLLYDQLPDVSSEECFNKFVDDVSKKLYNTAKLCHNPLGYNSPIESVIRSVRESELNDNADTIYRRFAAGEISSLEWLNVRNIALKEMSTNLTQSELDRWKIVIESKNCKELWQKIDWKGEINQSNVSADVPSLDSLADQFLSKSSSLNVENTLVEVNSENNSYVDVLDRPIDVDEVREGCKHLKASKATFDGWSPNMITRCSDTVFPIITFIFNFILLNHIFPINWILTLISPIFKNKGSRDIAKYFRPVSLIKMLPKLLDFVLLKRFKNWFTPSDEQSAYQVGRSCADNVFLIRYLISLANRSKQKLYLITVDFDGAFDRISRSQLFKKLVLFGAGATYVSCLMAIYHRTECIIFGNKESISYEISNGIKQGSPISPMLFLFYIDDMFAYFISTFASLCIYETIHVLMHADDLILTASTRELVILKLKHLVSYCSRNSIKLEPSKSKFIVINGTQEDHIDLKVNDIIIAHCSHLSLLGSHLSESGCLKDDMDHHLKKRYQACIKFYNFNKFAPLFVKLKVLKSCVLSNLLYNCETFGKEIPKQIEILYFKLLKTALGARSNTPNDIILIECGFLPIVAIIYGRQLNFFRKFKNALKDNSSRSKLFHILLANPPSYLKHYVDLDKKYGNSNEIFFEHLCKLKDKIRTLGSNEANYRYYIYLVQNPNLTPSVFIHKVGYLPFLITKFRLGSHLLPIETGRWCRKPRGERLCVTCGVLGDERHILYNCIEVDRTGIEIPEDMNDFWKSDIVFELFERINRLRKYF